MDNESDITLFCDWVMLFKQPKATMQADAGKDL